MFLVQPSEAVNILQTLLQTRSKKREPSNLIEKILGSSNSGVAGIAGGGGGLGARSMEAVITNSLGSNSRVQHMLYCGSHKFEP